VLSFFFSFLDLISFSKQEKMNDESMRNELSAIQMQMNQTTNEVNKFSAFNTLCFFFVLRFFLMLTPLLIERRKEPIAEGILISSLFFDC